MPVERCLNDETKDRKGFQVSDMTANVTVDLDGNLPLEARRYDKAFGTLATRTQRNARLLSSAGRHASAGLDRLSNRYTALATGAGAIGTLRFLGNLDERLRALGVQANAPAERIDELKNKMFEIANAPDIRVDPAGLLDAVEKIIEKTGDLDLAEANLENVGLAMRAASAEGVSIGAMIADLDKKFAIKGPEEMRQTLDALVNQGKQGAFTLQNLASQGERVTAAYGQFGRTGTSAAREMGAALQLIRQGTGSAEQAATALEALVRTLNDAEKSKLLEGAGIQLLDPDDPSRMRSVLAIMEDIIKATGGDVRKISKIFDAEAMRAFSAAIVEFKQTGGLQSVQEFLDVDDSGASILADAKRNAEGANAAIQKLVNAAKSYSESNLAGHVQDLANAIDKLDPETLNSTIDAIGKGALAVGGLVIAGKAIGGISSAVRGIRAFRGGSRGSRAASGVAAAGATPVSVVNWPIGFAAGGGGGGRSAKNGGRVSGFQRAGRGAGIKAALTAPGLAGRAIGAGKSLLGRAGLPLVALFSAVDAIQALADGDGEGAVGAGGRLAGAAAGGSLGALLGSAIPGLGTLIGGLVGAGAGAFAGEEGAQALYRLLVGVDPDSGQITVRTEGNAEGVEIDAGALAN